MEGIIKKVIEVLNEQTDSRTYDASIIDKSLFSVDVNLDPIQMVYLVLYVERFYGIRFTEEDFDSAEFFTLRGFCNKLYNYTVSK